MSRLLRLRMITAQLAIWLHACSIRPWRHKAARRRPWIRAARRMIAAVLSVYLLILILPELLFAHHLHHRNFHVYSEIPIDRGVIAVLDEAATLMARSSLDEPKMEHRLFLCDSPLKRLLLAPRNDGSFGTTYSVLLRRNTILNRTDVPANLVFRDAPVYNRRSLSAVIAHERVHALMDCRYGDLACARLPDWKKEGYCEYIAGSPSFDIDQGKRLVREGRADASGPFRYFRYRLMVKYLMDIENLDIDEIIARTFGPDELIAKVQKHIEMLFKGGK